MNPSGWGESKCPQGSWMSGWHRIVGFPTSADPRKEDFKIPYPRIALEQKILWWWNMFYANIWIHQRQRPRFRSLRNGSVHSGSPTTMLEGCCTGRPQNRMRWRWLGSDGWFQRIPNILDDYWDTFLGQLESSRVSRDIEVSHQLFNRAVLKPWQHSCRVYRCPFGDCECKCPSRHNPYSVAFAAGGDKNPETESYQHTLECPGLATQNVCPTSCDKLNDRAQEPIHGPSH